VNVLDWAKQVTSNTVSHDGNVLKRNSKTTLLVAPLSVIANWEEQIATHIRPGTVSSYIYHGNSRSRNVEVLAGYDVVITSKTGLSPPLPKVEDHRTSQSGFEQAAGYNEIETQTLSELCTCTALLPQSRRSSERSKVLGDCMPRA